jgi:hypothetical protein
MTPPRPLRQESHLSDPELSLGARLLASTGPLPKSEARKRRVWNALGAGRPSRLGFRLTAVRAGFASVLFAAASSAAVGRYYIERPSEDAPILAPSAPIQAATARAMPPPRVARPTPPPVAEVEPRSPPPPVVAVRPKNDAASRRRAGAEADAELLLEAMRARKAGNSQRVSELVAAYRAKHPRGVLQEEALILSVESAVARRAPNAPSLAREYLARYPNGRFAAQAQRALAAASR